MAEHPWKSLEMTGKGWNGQTLLEMTVDSNWLEMAENDKNEWKLLEIAKNWLKEL